MPFVGNLLAEAIGTFIPNQRLDRLSTFAKVLAEKVETMDQEAVRRQFSSPGFIDLLESGFVQAARATSEDRIKYIASLVSRGLTTEEAKLVQTKKLLWLLGELNDIEILLLRSHLRHPQQDQEFQRKHANVLYVRSSTMGCSDDEHEAATLHESYKATLVRLGLLRAHFKRPTSSKEIPEFDDKTGMMKASYHEVSSLGRILLDHIDLA